MFFIDDDQAKVLERQEKRRPCAHDQPGLSTGDLGPAAPSFGLRDAGVPFSRVCTETRFDTGQKFGGQRNFRQQNKDLPPVRQTFGDSLQIDLGLARAGHALEQRGPISAGSNGGLQRIRRLLLIGSQRFAGAFRVQWREVRIARHVLFQHRPGCDEALDDTGRNLGHPGEFRQREEVAGAVAQDVDHLGRAGVTRSGAPVPSA